MTPAHHHYISRKTFLKAQLSGLAGLGLAPGILFGAMNMAETESPGAGYRVLGRTGLKVGPIGFGASLLMEMVMVRRALDLGTNFLDTARDYGNGRHEEMVGQAIKGQRGEVIIQSRISKMISQLLGEKDGGKQITAAMEASLAASLKALQTDYIDVLLLHDAKSVTLIQHEAVLAFFQRAREQGKIRAGGFASHSSQLELLRTANRNRFYDVVMVPYNHKGAFQHFGGSLTGAWDQAALEKELLLAAEGGMGIVAMKTCSGGPYAFEGEPEATYTSALKWVVDHPFVHTAPVTLANISQLNEDLVVLG